MSKDSKKDNIERILQRKKSLREDLDPNDLAESIIKGDLKELSRTITLIESSRKDHQAIAQAVLQKILPHTGKSIRVGITGVPGVGKSTFIESFGNTIISANKKVAVLAIDPSSERSGGSILGDKTRMDTLSVNPNAFIRPTSAAGSLGGVARKTNETILLCEAAGFDVILIETVGVGQSETAVHQMTDFFLLLMLAGAGDELQGIKRGIMEMADALVITKADKENEIEAKKAAASYKLAMHLFPPLSNGWVPKVNTVSAYENKGIADVWKMVQEYQIEMNASGFIAANRKKQGEFWLKESFKNILLDSYFNNSEWQKEFEKCAEDVKNGVLTPHQAADKLISFT